MRHLDASSEVTLLYAEVIIEGGLDMLLEYAFESTMPLKEGMRVEVPVRTTTRKAIVVSIKNHPSFPKVLKISKILEEDWLSPDLITLMRWMHSYYAASYKKLFKLFTPSYIREEQVEKEILVYLLKKTKKETLTYIGEIQSKYPSQGKVLEVLLEENRPLLLAELLKLAKVSKAPVETLMKKNYLTTSFQKESEKVLLNAPYFISGPKKLNSEQAIVLEKILASLEKNAHTTHLVHGVTGSGKTEVYLQAISYIRKLGHSALVLVPEIALTTQMIERFKSRFDEPIAVYHHRLSDKEKVALWDNLKSGKVNILLGARSAVFAPLKNLKLIIVDEEHEDSFKQKEETPCYHAKDVAIMRSYLLKATVVLGSATPSIESYYKALSGKYLLSTMEKRASSASLPTVTLVNMLSEKERSQRGCLLSHQLLTAIEKRVAKGEQCLLFLNRRGYHSALFCSSCSSPLLCPHCDVSLTYHKQENHLRCHYCAHTISPPPNLCLTCKKPTVQFKGVGTEQVETTLHKIFPSIRTLRMDADTTKKKGSHEKLFKDFSSGKADVLIGTQMIAKGFDFPSVTLVGVLNADSGLQIPNFRAEENLFQLLAQVSGRAGRGALAGQVLIQTFMPEHNLFTYLEKEDYKGFYGKEIKIRKQFLYPPFIHLARLVFKGSSPEKTLDFANYYHRGLIKELSSNYLILPVVEDAIFKVKDRFHYTLHIKGPSMKEVAAALLKIQAKRPATPPFSLLIDIDC